MSGTQERRDRREEKRARRRLERRKRRIKAQKHAVRRTILYGNLTVSGEGSILIPIRGGTPTEAEARFIGARSRKMGCGPITEDQLEVSLEKKSPFPLWSVRLSWDIRSGNVRDIEWRVKVLR